MLFSIAVWLTIASLVFAAPPAAQSTYCYEDNLLRAFQHTPTPASLYCQTPTGKPTFLAVTTYPATRLSSACSCFSRFPTDPTVPTSTTTAPACATYTNFAFSSDTGGPAISIIVTIDLAQTCGTGGYLITSLCGSFFGGSLSLGSPLYGDNCYFPSAASVLDTEGVNVYASGLGDAFTFYEEFGEFKLYGPEGNFGFWTGAFAPVCGAAASC